MTIVHCVLLKTIGADDAIIEALDSLRKLIGVVPGLLTFEGGKYSSPEGLNRGFSWGFVMTFSDATSRDNYLVHPAHVAAAAGVLAVCEGGLAGVTAFDYEK